MLGLPFNSWKVKFQQLWNGQQGPAKDAQFCVSKNSKHGQLQNFWMYQKYCVKIVSKILPNTRSDSIYIEYTITIGMQGLNDQPFWYWSNWFAGDRFATGAGWTCSQLELRRSVHNQLKARCHLLFDISFK